MRYIHHSTGPKCMLKLLKLRCNAEVRRNLQFLSSNNFVEGAQVSISAKRMYDVLSFESKSYYGERTAFKSMVGDGEGALPVLNGSQPSGCSGAAQVLVQCC